MNESEFLEKVEKADKQLSKKQVPIHARAFHAFHILAPDYVGPVIGYGVNSEDYPEFVGPNLLNRLSDWYEKIYGKRSYMPTDRGRIPVIIRGEVYLIRIPLAFGQPRVSILPLVEGLTKDMIRSLSQVELKNIKDNFVAGYSLIYEIEDLRESLAPKGTISLKNTILQTFQSAIEDRDTASRCLSGQLDTNGACFHAQQHAEKMLKFFLLSKGVCTEAQIRKRPYAHNLINILSKCVDCSSSFVSLSNDISLLNNIPMDIRYTIAKVNPEVAEGAFWSSLRVGGLSACEVSGFDRRYKI